MTAGAELVDAIANAVLYEGYILYPYRASALKNQRRWTFGGVFPRPYCEANPGSDPSSMQTQCLVQDCGPGCRVQVTVRFLQLVNRTVGHLGREPGELEPVESLEIGGKTYVSWQEAVEQSLDAGQVEPGGVMRLCVQLPAGRGFEPLSNEGGRSAGIARTWELIRGEVDVDCERLGSDLARITVRVVNDTPLQLSAGASREQVASHAMVSSHIVLRVQNGKFVSATDPPDELRQPAAACQNMGCWPVLVGEPPGRLTMLASPIILEDYPRVAQQSPGDFFDATEIDELLSLRILTLTDEEKAEMRGADEKTRLLLERTEALNGEQLLRLHGTARIGWPEGEDG